MVNARAAANHRFTVALHVPGEAQARIEIVLILLRRFQIAVEERAQNRRAIQIVIEQLVLVSVGDSICEREVRFDAPTIGEEETQTVVARRIVAIERLRLSGITDAGGERSQWQL